MEFGKKTLIVQPPIHSNDITETVQQEPQK
jgi:hypothetical protein